MVEVGVEVAGEGRMDRDLNSSIQDRRMDNIICQAVASASVHLLGARGWRISTLEDLAQHLEALPVR